MMLVFFSVLAVMTLSATIFHGAAFAGQHGKHGKNRATKTLTILAAGDLRGEIEPCGCSPEGQMGGLRRRLSYLERQFASGAPLLVDLGNNFPHPSPQGRL